MQERWGATKTIYVFLANLELSCLAHLHILQVSARVLQKVVTKGSFRGKETPENNLFENIFLTHKRWSTT